MSKTGTERERPWGLWGGCLCWDLPWWEIAVQGKEQGVLVWPDSLSAQQGHADTPRSVSPCSGFSSLSHL